MRERTIFVVNLNGIGNGICILPVLKCLEENNVSFFHNENPVLRNKWFLKQFELTKLKGLTPALWRRFEEKDWMEILRFLVAHNVTVVASVRNEGPEFDIGYYRFKEWCKTNKKNIEFWDFDFEQMKSCSRQQLIVRESVNLFQEHGLDMSSYNPQWLAEHLPNNTGETEQKIGLFTGSRQANKRWAIENWKLLGDLLNTHLGYTIEVFGGTSEEEIEFAREITESISKNNKGCRLIVNLSLEKLVEKFRGLNLLVSNDTFAVHLASALNIPTVGLYLATNGDVWGGDSKSFTPVQSMTALSCKNTKPLAGNCLHFYEGCPTSCRKGEDVTPERVFETITKKLNQPL